MPRKKIEDRGFQKEHPSRIGKKQFIAWIDEKHLDCLKKVAAYYDTTMQQIIATMVDGIVAPGRDGKIDYVHARMVARNRAYYSGSPESRAKQALELLQEAIAMNRVRLEHLPAGKKPIILKANLKRDPTVGPYLNILFADQYELPLTKKGGLSTDTKNHCNHIKLSFFREGRSK